MSPRSPLPLHNDEIIPLAATGGTSLKGRAPGRFSLSKLGGRPVLRWVALLISLLALGWFFSPWAVSDRFESWRGGIRPNLGIEDDVGVDGGLGGVPVGVGLEDELDPPPKAPPQISKIWESRREEVKKSFMYAWDAYMEKGYPYDEVLPNSGSGKNNFNGWSVTLVDSLSTMWLMGLKDEFYEAAKLIENQKFTATAAGGGLIPFFETVIRHLGGYLSAYALSGDKLMLKLADDLGEQLIRAFNTTSKLPAGAVAPVTGQLTYGAGLLAEIGSCQLEFKYMAKMTGKAEYYEKVEYVMEHLYNAKTYNNLFAENWSIANGGPTGGRYTVAANTDSTYEYFLKQYLMMGDKRALKQYLKSMEGVIDNLLYVSPSRGLLYLTDLSGGAYTTPYPSHNHEHLGCYLPGLFALGAHALPQLLSPRELHELFPEEMQQKHKWAAEGLTYTCWMIYKDQKSGLSSDGTTFNSGGPKWVDALKKWESKGSKGKPPGLTEPPREVEVGRRDYRNAWPERYLMRPETVESIYLMWKTTGDEVWRERGYEVYQAIEKHTKAPFGYGSVHHVNQETPTIIDDMPSFFLAETLKYLYLLFDDEDPISLDKWVFNTEAHPLPVFEWTSEEKRKFGIVEE